MANIEKSLDHSISIEEDKKPSQKDKEDDLSLHETAYVKRDIKSIKGIGLSMAEKLKNNGFDSIEKIAHSSPEQLSLVKGIGFETARKIIEYAITISTSYHGIKSLNSFTGMTNDASDIEGIDDELEDENETLYEEDDNYISKPEFENESDYTIESLDDEAEEIERPLIIPTETSSRPIFEEKSFESRESVSYRSDIVESESKVQLTTPEKENMDILIESELKQLRDITKDILSLSGYFLIPHSASLKTLHSRTDFIGAKVVPVSDFLQLIIIVPLKICPFRGELDISQDYFAYNEFKQPAKTSIIHNKITSEFHQLYRSSEKIFSNLMNESTLLTFFRNYLKVNVELEKTRINRKLFFCSGPVQYKILVEPVYVSMRSVKFLEKIIPFAYLKNSNLHIVSSTQLTDLLHYLESKYHSIETYEMQEPVIKQYFKAEEKFLNQIRISLISPLLFVVIVIFVYSFQAFFLFDTLLNIGIPLGLICFSISGFLLLKNYLRKSKLRKDFRTPYYLKKRNFDETSLTLIKESLPTTLMVQFTYEVIDNSTSSSLINKIEVDHSEEIIMKEEFVSNSSDNNFFEEKQDVFPTSEISEKVKRKYSSFLED